VGLPYWKAMAAFALTEEEVWTHREWRLKFPDVYEQLDALMDNPPPEMGKVWIPYALLVEMAKQTPLFFATNGEWLMSTIDRVGIPSGYEEISALEAMERYSPEHVFEAADKASCYVGNFK
jgi:hypothetical protein